MKSKFLVSTARGLIVAVLFAGLALSQGRLAGYQRGQGLQAGARDLVVNVPGPAPGALTCPGIFGDRRHLTQRGFGGSTNAT